MQEFRLRQTYGFGEIVLVTSLAAEVLLQYCEDLVSGIARMERARKAEHSRERRFSASSPRPVPHEYGIVKAAILRKVFTSPHLSGISILATL
jgi:hypothetical protein